MTDNTKAWAQELEQGLLERVAEGTGAATVITDADGRIKWVNTAFTSITGYSLEEAAGKTPGSLLQGPLTDAAVVTQMREALRRGAGFDVEILNYHKRGGTCWLHLKVDPVFDEHGTLTHFIGIQNEITARVEAQQRIDSLNQRLALAVSGSGFGVWEFDLANSRLIWDGTMYELYGHTPETFDGSPDAWRACLHPDDRDIVDQRFADLLAGHTVGLFEFRIIRATDGAVRCVEANGCPQLDRTGRVVRLVGMNRDATERRMAAIAIAASEARFESLLNSSDAVVWESDPETFQFTFVSARAERLLGYPRERWLNEPTFWRDHIHPEDREATLESCVSSVRAMQAHRLEYRMLAADGRVVWVEDLVSIHVQDGRPQLLRGVIVDITERKALAQRLQRAEKMEMIGQLAGGIAHDFNNILAAMTLSLEHIRSERGAPRRELLDELRSLTQRASSLTSQLLTFAGKQELRVSPIEVNGLLRRTLQMLARVLGPGITIDFKPSEEMWIEGDASLIEQAFVNLCINARDAMPNSGTLTVEISETADEASQAAPGGGSGRAMVQIRVLDTGHGMSKEVLDRVFEPFFTTKEIGKGTGLGLASVHGVLQQHGGRITAHSEVGQGTRFDLWLPRAAAPAGRPAVPQNRVLPRGTETVLLVEDEPAVRRLTGRMLESLGYRVLYAADAVQARALWQAHHADIDLLFADIMMPGGVTGTQLSQELRASRPTLRVLLMTGGRRGMEDGTLAPGSAEALLPKPFGKRDLALTLRRCLDADRASLPSE